MKLLAQSLIPTNPAPYTHLGYTSALANSPLTYEREYGAAIWIGLCILCIGLAFLADIGVVTRLRKVLGYLLIGIGCTVSVIAFHARNEEASRPAPYRYPVAATYDHAWYIRVSLQHNTTWLASMKAEGRPHPIPDLYKRPTQLKDGWGTPMMMTYHGGNPPVINIISAGPDTRFTTTDDLVIPNDSPTSGQIMDRIANTGRFP